MKNNLSVKWRLMLVFLAIAVLIVAIYFVMNNLFWGKFFMDNNRNEVKETYNILQEQFAVGNLSTTEISESIYEKHRASGINVAIQGDGDWEFMLLTREMVSPQERNFLLERLQENFINPEPSGVRVLETGEYHTIQEVNVDGQYYYECFGYLVDSAGESKKFIISMPLEGYNRISRQSNSFFIWLSLAILLLGAALITFFTVRISKPIVQLTEISERMTDLDFSARYTGNSRDEIGTLGKNMNQLSDKLKQTISELQVTNEKLQKELEEKEHIDEMRREFISNVSHELKTPIALIQGYAEGLKDLKDEPDAMDYYIDVITDESDKMNRMVKKLTNLNQLEFGQADLNPEPFVIGEMIEGLLRSMDKMKEERQAEIQIRGEKDLTVVGDEFEIEEVLTNYLSNAFNHLKEPNRIEVNVERTETGKARITVFNTGDAIPEESLEKVWVKFYKVDKARTRAYGGSGIGLSIVKAIMDAHGEAYGVYNTEGGVAFWFELPVKEA